MSGPTGYQGLPGITTWDLEVAEAFDVTPRMRRVRLTSPALSGFEHLPGQDMMLVIPQGPDRTVRRRFTIRRFDRNRRLIDLDFLLHGGGPAMRWAVAARPGDHIEVVGPRGKITLAGDADWHLFAGDETAMPGAFAMMEALAPTVPGRAFLEIDGPAEEQPIEIDGGANRQVTWFHKQTAVPGDGTLVDVVAAAELPPGRGHAYLSGEVGLVSALQRALLARGLTPDQLSPKAYWNRGQANANNGEPERRVAPAGTEGG